MHETVKVFGCDGQDGNGLQVENLGEIFQVDFFNDIYFNGRSLFSLCQLKSYLPLDVQR